MLALLASLVGRSVEALGPRLGAGATGVVQSALGNLPELFVVLFALKSKLYEVATATMVGSVLANVLLVLGLAFVVGGAKNGFQRFEPAGARRVSLMLLILFVASLPDSIKKTAADAGTGDQPRRGPPAGTWVAAGARAGHARGHRGRRRVRLRLVRGRPDPAISTLHISQAFAAW